MDLSLPLSPPQEPYGAWRSVWPISPTVDQSSAPRATKD
jgi:hypothetical protein